MKIIIYLAVSANGLISNQRNVPDWLSAAYGQGFMELSRRTQAVIMGKKTYDILAPDNLPLKEGGSLMVITHDTAITPPQSNIFFTSQDPQQVIRHLEGRGHTEAVIIGGMQTATTFIKANLVNELILVVEPVLFGGGLPMFEAHGLECRLSLLNIEKLDRDSVQLHYKVNACTI